MSSTTKATHTPTPYRAAKFYPGKYTIVHGHGRVRGISGETTTLIAHTDEATPGDLANAEFICRACNSHEALLAALVLAEEFMVHQDDPSNPHDCPGAPGHDAENCCLCTGRAALALAAESE